MGGLQLKRLIVPLFIIVALTLGCSKKSDVKYSQDEKITELAQKAITSSSGNDFPVRVAAELSQGMHIAMVQNGIDSPQYVVNLRISNIGDSDIKYKLMKASFVNPTTEKGMTSTVMKSNSKLSDPEGFNPANAECFVLKPKSTDTKNQLESNGWTYDILAGLGKDEKIVLLVEFVGEDGEHLATYGCRLPELGDLPSTYSSKGKSVVAQLERADR